MPVREGPPEPAPPPRSRAAHDQPPPYPAEKARGGEIILRTRTRRVVFIAGLAGALLLGMMVSLLV